MAEELELGAVAGVIAFVEGAQPMFVFFLCFYDVFCKSLRGLCSTILCFDRSSLDPLDVHGMIAAIPFRFLFLKITKDLLLVSSGKSKISDGFLVYLNGDFGTYFLLVCLHIGRFGF